MSLYIIYFQMIGTFSSAMAGPMAGVFLVGMFIPWINVKVLTLVVVQEVEINSDGFCSFINNWENELRSVLFKIYLK